MLHGSLYNLTQRLMSPHQNKVAHLFNLPTKYPLFTADLSILGIMKLQSVTNNTVFLFKISFHHKAVTDIQIQHNAIKKPIEAVLLITVMQQCHIFIFLIKIVNRMTDNNSLRIRDILWSDRSKVRLVFTLPLPHTH